MLINKFLGQDRDTNPKRMQPGFFRDLLNCRVIKTDGGNNDAVEKAKGNVLISNPLLPAGTNHTIGSVEDQPNNAVYFFNYNSNGNHCIFKYYRARSSNEIELVLKTPLLGFTLVSRIRNARLIGNLLFWLDPVPRMINVDKANETNKPVQFNVYFGDTRENIFTDGTTFSFLFNAESFPAFYTSFSINDFADGLIEITRAFNNLSTIHSLGFTATQNGYYMSVTGPAGTKGILVNASNNSSWAVPQNVYTTLNGSYFEQYIDVIKYPPHFPIVPQLKKDETRESNQIRGKVFQFRYRFIYDNDEKSAWSPYSVLALDNIVSNGDILKTRKNYIELDYSDNNRLATTPYRNMVKKVELGYREGNTGQLQSFKVLEQYELTGTYKFYNDQYAAVVDPASSNKEYDSVPFTANAQEIAKNRLFYADYEEGKDEVPVDTRFNIDFSDTPQKATWTIKGPVLIKNLLSADGEGARFNLIKPEDGVYYFGSVIWGDRKARMIRMKQDIPARGFTFYLAGTNYFNTSIQDNSPSSTPFDAVNGGQGQYVSRYEIKNVPPGKYKLRVASHHCVAGAGNIYDLNNVDLGWQTTSTNLVMIGGIDPATDGTYEIEIDLPDAPPGGGVFDMTDPANGFPNSGYSIVGDLSWYAFHGGLEDDEVVAAVTGYYVHDTTNENSKENMAGALRVEGQRSVFDFGTLSYGDPVTSLYTDHNGYYYGCAKIVSQADFSPPGRIILLAFEAVHSQFLTHSYDNTFIGSISNTGALAIGVIRSNDEDIETIAYVTDQDLANSLRTAITGNVVDSSGEALSDVSVVFARNGRQTLTDGNGDFVIIAYQFQNHSPGRTSDALIVNYQVVNTLNISPYTGDNPGSLPDTFDSTHPFYTNPNTTGSVFPIVPYEIAISDVFISAPKRGGFYRVGILYFERGNRGTRVCFSKKGEIYIPFFSEDLNKTFPNQYPSSTYKYGQASITWNIYSIPPAWATHYCWARTRDTVYQKYLQIVASSVEYAVRYDPAAVPPIYHTTYGSSEAKQVYIDLKTAQYYSEDNSGNFDDINALDYNNVTYTWTPGDRLRVITDKDGVFLSQFFDVEIKGDLGQKIIIDYLISMPELGQGSLIEVYTPRNIQQADSFFEIGEFFEIGVDVDGNHYHKGPVQNQDIPTADITPAVGIFHHWDTYFRTRNMRTVNDLQEVPVIINFNLYVEDANVSDFFPSLSSDIGRINIIDKDYKKVQRSANLRFGGKLIPETSINEICNFEALNNEELDKAFGSITGMRILNYTLVVLQQHETTSVYVETSVLRDVNDEQLINISDKVINNKNVLKKGLGCQDAGSITTHENNVYFWDRKRGAMVRYAENGNYAISKYGMVTFFADLSKAMNSDNASNIDVISIFDDRFGEMLTTFKYTVDDVDKSFTIAFNEDANKWVSRYSFIPENYCTSAEDIVSFKGGDIYLHNSNPVYMNFYGVQYKATMQFIFNGEPDNVKHFKTMFIFSTICWDIPVISIEPNNESPAGMESELLSTDFVEREGGYYASFFNNKLTPNVASEFIGLIEGEALRGNVLILNMEDSSAELNVLTAIDVNYANSYYVNFK